MKNTAAEMNDGNLRLTLTIAILLSTPRFGIGS
jgi:hypothetical protein